MKKTLAALILSILLILGAVLISPGKATKASAAAPPKPTVTVTTTVTQTVTVTATVTATVTVTAPPSPPPCTPSAPINITGGNNIIIENMCFTDSQPYAIRLVNTTGGITIRNNQFIRPGDGIIISGTATTGPITIEGNYMEDLHPPGSQPPVNNYVHGIAINNVGAEPGILIQNNTIDGGLQDIDGDWINLWQSGGTAASPAMITRNRVRGCRPGGLCNNPPNGAGIIAGDQPACSVPPCDFTNDYIIVRENLLINATNRVGIGIAGGHDSTMDRNIIYGSAIQAGYVNDWRNIGGCFNITVTGNHAGGSGNFHDYGNCGTLTMSGNNWSDPNVTASLWGQSWDQLLLILG